MRVIWILLASAAYAPHAVAEVLSLDQAVERALRYDARIKEQEHLVEVARGQQKEAEHATDTIFDINLFVGIAPKTPGDILYQDETTDDPKFRKDIFDIEGVAPWYNLDFAIIKPLATFGKVKNYTEAAKANVEVKKGEISVQRGRIIVDVHRAYYGFLAAQDSRLLVEDVRNRLTKATENVQRWLNEGSGKFKQSDLFALQTGTALAGRYIAEAQGLERIALDGLRTLTGVGLGKDLELSDKKLVPVDLPKESLKEFQSRAMAQRPEVAQLEAGLTARRALVEANKSESKPNIYTGLVGSIAYTPGREPVYSTYVYDVFNHGALTPVLGVKWDWDSGRQPARVQQAQSELNALVEKSSFARDGIPFQVAEAYQKVQTYRTMVDEMAQSSRAGRRWMISTYADFEAGLEQTTNVMSAFTGYVQAHAEYLRTVNEYNMQVVQLRFVTGDLK